MMKKVNTSKSTKNYKAAKSRCTLINLQDKISKTKHLNYDLKVSKVHTKPLNFKAN